MTTKPESMCYSPKPILKYCAECFSININHRIFVHHIVFEHQWVPIFWLIDFAVIYWNFESRLKTRKTPRWTKWNIFFYYCCTPWWIEGKCFNQYCFEMRKEHWGTEFCPFTKFLCICSPEERPGAVLHVGAKTRLLTCHAFSVGTRSSYALCAALRPAQADVTNDSLPYSVKSWPPGFK